MSCIELELLFRIMTETGNKNKPNVEFLKKAIDALPEPEKTVIISIYGLDENTPKNMLEVAEILGCDEDTVLTHLGNGLRCLRKLAVQEE